MNWLNVPKQDVTPDWGCGIRVCPSKEYCDGYFCVVLSCGSNSEN